MRRVGDAPHSGHRAVGAPTGARLVISRAAFLACSWTWIIGMYLPIILIREFGWAGWLAFAAPNVVGAGAMGLMLRRRGASCALLEGHERMASLFSAATIAFHAFFITWLCGFMFGEIAGRFAGVIGAVMMVAASAGLARLSTRGWDKASIAAWIVSVVFLALAMLTGGSSVAPASASGRSDWTGLLFVAPVCVFGFALCPYLDLTFHRIRRETPGRAGSASFVLGFGGLFLVMIVGTLLYAQGIISNDWWSYYIVAHMGVQSAFTVGAHARERATVGARRGVINSMLTPALLGVAAGLVPGTVLHPNYSAGETVYVLFMALYGLVFPGYVWLVMGSRRRRAIVWWVVAVVIASPFFWMGFVERDWWWLGPGLLPVLGARLATMRQARGTPGRGA